MTATRPIERLRALWAVGVLNLAAAVALLLAPQLPGVTFAVGVYLTTFATGVLFALGVGLPLRRLRGVLVVPCVSWLATIVSALILAGAQLEFTVPLLAGLLGAWQLIGVVAFTILRPTDRAGAAPGRTGRTVVQRAVSLGGYAAGTVAIVAGLVFAASSQQPQDGVPFTQARLGAQLQHDPEVKADAGTLVTVPVEIQSSSTIACSDVSVQVDGTATTATCAGASGTTFTPTLGFTAPQKSGRHRVSVVIANPTYRDVQEPANPAYATGPDAEALGGAKELTLTVWVVVP